jgi:hydrogenase maturation protease
MAQRSSIKSVLIVTWGNPDAGDDSFGHAVAQGLRADPLPGTTVVEMGTRPADLLDHAWRYDALIVVDAVCAPGEKPGILIDVDWFDPARPALNNEAELSTHGMSIGQQIRLAQSLEMLQATVRLVGVTIAHSEIGSLMTEPVRKCVPDAVKLIRKYAICMRK